MEDLHEGRVEDGGLGLLPTFQETFAKGNVLESPQLATDAPLAQKEPTPPVHKTPVKKPAKKDVVIKSPHGLPMRVIGPGDPSYDQNYHSLESKLKF